MPGIVAVRVLYVFSDGEGSRLGCRSARLRAERKACGRPNRVNRRHTCERRGRRSQRPRRARSPSLNTYPMMGFSLAEGHSILI